MFSFARYVWAYPPIIKRLQFQQDAQHAPMSANTAIIIGIVFPYACRHVYAACIRQHTPDRNAQPYTRGIRMRTAPGQRAQPPRLYEEIQSATHKFKGRQPMAKGPVLVADFGPSTHSSSPAAYAKRTSIRSLYRIPCRPTMLAGDPKAIILSGGPASYSELRRPHHRPRCSMPAFRCLVSATASSDGPRARR